jgi:hypothetical protein
MKVNKKFQNELQEYYERACERYSKNRIICTYFDGAGFCNIVIPTAEMLCSFENQVDGNDLIPESTFAAIDHDVRNYAPKDLLEIQESLPCLFRNNYIEAIKENRFETLVLRNVFEEDKEYDDNQIPEFLKEITKKEQQALADILNRLNPDGTLVFSTLVAETGISRPVYNNLIVKIKQFNIAEVTNMGMKGTYLNFYNYEKLKSAIN